MNLKARFWVGALVALSVSSAAPAQAFVFNTPNERIFEHPFGSLFDTRLLGIDATECAFVGDDLPDLALLEHVGLSIAVANAVQAVQEQCDYITRKPGGFGAVREVCDLVAGSRDDRTG